MKWVAKLLVIKGLVYQKAGFKVYLLSNRNPVDTRANWGHMLTCYYFAVGSEFRIRYSWSLARLYLEQWRAKSGRWPGTRVNLDAHVTSGLGVSRLKRQLRQFGCPYSVWKKVLSLKRSSSQFGCPHLVDARGHRPTGPPLYATDVEMLKNGAAIIEKTRQWH